MDEILQSQREYFATGETLPLSFRKQQLRTLKTAIQKYEPQLLEALSLDLNKCSFEGYETEIGIVYTEINEMEKKLDAWAKPQRVHAPLMQFPSRCYTVWEPLGCALIMSPWNYPVQLTLAPLVGAIAAGDCAVIKPSRYSAHTALALQKMVEEFFPTKYIAVFQGGADVNTELLRHKFDLIFFTGSPRVGRVVMESAAQFLTPVVLELGGKSPCIIDRGADLKLAARRMAWGKCINAGQTCVAPDYVVCHKAEKEEFILRLKEALHDFYGDDFLDNPEFCSIINDKHFERLQGLMKSGETVFGGRTRAQGRRIEPTILDNVTPDDPVMGEEIFGPLIPILTWETPEELWSIITKFDKPLACYVFTRDRAFADDIVARFSFGGGCINDTVMHLAVGGMPFGGVGNSGMRGYHGRDSFEVFSHKKSILDKKLWLDIPVRYAPYRNKLKTVRMFMH